MSSRCAKPLLRSGCPIVAFRPLQGCVAVGLLLPRRQRAPGVVRVVVLRQHRARWREILDFAQAFISGYPKIAVDRALSIREGDAAELARPLFFGMAGRVSAIGCLILLICFTKIIHNTYNQGKHQRHY